MSANESKRHNEIHILPERTRFMRREMLIRSQVITAELFLTFYTFKYIGSSQLPSSCALQRLSGHPDPCMSSVLQSSPGSFLSESSSRLALSLPAARRSAGPAADARTLNIHTRKHRVLIKCSNLIRCWLMWFTHHVLSKE